MPDINGGAQTSWGCDVPISMPDPVPDADLPSVSMGSHIFTINGLRINTNKATLQEQYAPTYAPPKEML